MNNYNYNACPACKMPIGLQRYCENCHRLNININNLKGSFKIPEFLKKDPNTGKYYFERSWVKPFIKIITLFCALLCCFLFIWGLIKMDPSFSILRSMIFGLSAYILAVFSFNKTRIFISPEEIQVKRGPVYLPLADSFIIKKEDIKRLDIYKEIYTGKYGTTYTFSFKIITKKDDILDLFDFKKETEAAGMYGFLHNLLDLKIVRERLSDREVWEFNESKANKVSKIYCIVIPGGFFLNVICLPVVKKWKFDLNYWAFFTLFTFIMFLIFYFHHRKYLSIIDSKPLRKKEDAGGPVFYAIL